MRYFKTLDLWSGVVIFWTFISIFKCVSAENKEPSDAIPLPEGYNQMEIPVIMKDDKVDKKVYVYVSMFIRKILEIDEKREVITLDTDFRLHWVDWKINIFLHGLNFTDPKTNLPITTRTVGSDALHKIWNPDTFIDEMKSLNRTSILNDLVSLQFLGKTGDITSGDIVYTSRNTLKLRCNMQFHYFPADTQTCNYHIRSYSHNETFLELRWAHLEKSQRSLAYSHKQKGVYLNDPSDPNFRILVENVKPENLTSRLFIHERFDYFRIGRYELLTFSIKIRRKLSYHLVQTYLPSVILILITWLCFMLPTNMVEARITITMTTLLTLTAMFASVRRQSPEVSYTMAIDVWMVFCIFCVFVALLLFTLIYWMKRNLKKFLDAKSGPTPNLEKQWNKTMHVYEKVVTFSEVYAFRVLVFVFISFLFAYWIWLLWRSRYFDWYPNPWFNADPFNKTTNLYQCPEGNDNKTGDANINEC